jgi:hypothetical protein
MALCRFLHTQNDIDSALEVMDDEFEALTLLKNLIRFVSEALFEFKLICACISCAGPT